MSPSRLWRSLLVACFLLAQQGALAHQVWHFGATDSVAAVAQPGDTANGNPLCSQHGALEAVLGALSGSAALPVLADALPASVFPAASPAASLPGLSPSSRGPPASL
jgi:hypothetical protein